MQGDQQQLTIVADTQLDNAAAFSKLIVKSADGKSVRLGDVTRVIDSVANNQTASWYDGSRAIILAVQRQPDANTVAVVDAVKAMLPSFQSELPAAASLETLNDRAQLDPRLGQRRRVHAGADDRAGDPGDLHLRAAGLGDADPGACRADLADRDARA